ncbi:MAG: hypothetical protein K6G26_08370, partial [Lachnospiraceae bacterium]|nr:hypothetical protein [Lachnospiraceae bacterium]
KKYEDLMMISDIYINNDMYMDAKHLLCRMYNKKPTKKILVRLVKCSVKLENFVDAERYYGEYKELAEGDISTYIYRYKIDKAKGKGNKQLLETLFIICEKDYSKEWAYELAKIYHKMDEDELCIKECDKIIETFESGKIVEKAKLLKQFHEEGDLEPKEQEVEDKEEIAEEESEDESEEKTEENSEDETEEESEEEPEDETEEESEEEPEDETEEELEKEPEDETEEESEKEIEVKKEDDELDVNLDTLIRSSKNVNSDNIAIDERMDSILKENMMELDDIGDSLDVFFSGNETKTEVKSDDESKADEADEKSEADKVEDKEESKEKTDEDVEDEDFSGASEDDSEDEEESEEEPEEDSEDEEESEEEPEKDSVDKEEPEEKESIFGDDDDDDMDIPEIKEHGKEKESDIKPDTKKEETATDDSKKENKYDSIFSALSSSVSKIVDNVLEDYKEAGKTSAKKNASSAIKEARYTETFDKLAKANLDYIEINQDIFCNYYDIEILNYSIRKGIYNLQTNMMKANFIISGDRVSGRTTLARMLSHQLFEMKYIPSNKIARITGEKFNKVDLKAKAEKLLDGCIIIQEAENVASEVYDKLLEFIALYPGRVIVFLETKDAEALYDINNDLREFFNNIIEMPEYNLEDMVNFAHSYAAAHEYYISDSAESALRKALQIRYKGKIKSTNFVEVIKLIDKAMDRVETRYSGIKEFEEEDIKVIERRDIGL